MTIPIKTTKENQSIADYLIQLMPGLQIQFQPSKPTVDQQAAKALYSVWKDEDNKLSDGTYVKPTTLGKVQVDAMESEGLAKSVGAKLEITEKGADVIKVFVLGDDSSIFDGDDRMMEYSAALAHTKNASRRSGGLSKVASNNWWERFDKK